MSFLSLIPIFDRVFGYLGPKELNEFVRVNKDIYELSMTPHNKAKLYDYSPKRAAKYGDLEIIKWLHVNHSDKFTQSVMNKAAKYGHLYIVKWLRENRTEGCNSRAVTGAAKNGHLRVIKWIYKHLIFKNSRNFFTIEAINKAAANGHLDVIIWMHTNFRHLSAAQAMICAIKNGHLNVVKFIYQYYPEIRCNIDTIDIIAYEYKQTEILNWLYDKDFEINQFNIKQKYYKWWRKIFGINFVSKQIRSN